LITIRKYEDKDRSLWDGFVASAKNATFLFYRGFMEYHKDRFIDYSLLCFNKEKLVAILPANVNKNIVHSHQGLTYGGLVIQSKVKFEEYVLIFEQLLKFLDNNKVEQLYIKELPSMYSDGPSNELEYVQYLIGAENIRVDISSTIEKSTSTSISRDRITGYKRGVKHKLRIIEVEEMDSFWNQILIPNLLDKHKVKPVHDLEEIKLLKNKFPKNIRQFNVYKEDEIVAGTTIFETKKVAHSQYISGNSDKNKFGSLDFLHHYLISEVFKEKPFFDFGISTENKGMIVNKGLLSWKEGFGARATTYKTYCIETINHQKISKIFI